MITQKKFNDGIGKPLKYYDMTVEQVFKFNKRLIDARRIAEPFLRDDYELMCHMKDNDWSFRIEDDKMICSKEGYEDFTFIYGSLKEAIERE